MTDYDIDQWAAETAEGRRIFNAGFRMLPVDLAEWELVKAIPFEASRGKGEFVYMWQRGGGLELLRVWLAELPDWRSAQNRLLEDLRMSMRSDIPRGTGRLARLGDVSYVSRSAESDIASSISFVRGNVCGTVRSVGDREADASEPALWLDQALALPPGRDSDETEVVVRGRRVRSRRVYVRAREAGEASVVVEDVEQASEEAWIKGLADQGELLRREGALMHVASARGRARIELSTYTPLRRRGQSPGKTEHGGTR